MCDKLLASTFCILDCEALNDRKRVSNKLEAVYGLIWVTKLDICLSDFLLLLLTGLKRQQ
jgi:hypothetical protein